ncbi:MAG: response regulator [Magnetococcales bacterium]|nr:response regulator [Magnetococcales bacterium]
MSDAHNQEACHPQILALQAEVAEWRQIATLAQEANQAKSRYLAHFSHEIRTPLHIILGLSQRIEEQASAHIRQQLGTRLSTIRAAGEHLMELVSGMLDLARIEAGQCRLNQLPMDPALLLQDVANWFQEEARKRGNRVETACDAKIGLVMSDPLRLRQILLNLLGNANRFTEQGEISARLQRLEQATDQVHLLFTVEDTGSGIPAERMQGLFDPFVSGDDQSVEAGAGLGLAICKILVEQMGGTIQVASLPGEGSRFSFTLLCPIARALPEMTGRSPATIVPIRPRTILFIEDDPMSHDMLVELLREDGHQVVVPKTGQDPLEIIHTQSVDLVLTDLHMPDRDGFSIIRAIRALPDLHLSNLPILVLTADALPEHHQTALRSGANLLLTKPIHLNRLREALANPFHHKDDGILQNDSNTFLEPLIDTRILDQTLFSLGHDRFLEICQKFPKIAEEALQTLHAVLSQQDHATLAHVAHRLAGSAAHLGLLQLAQLAEHLAQEIRQRQAMPERSDARIRDLSHAIHLAHAALQQWMATINVTRL